MAIPKVKLAGVFQEVVSKVKVNHLFPSPPVPFSIEPVDQGPANYNAGTNTTTMLLEFITTANQSLRMEYSINNSTWTLNPTNPVSSGPVGNFLLTLTASGDHADDWNSALYFRATRLN